MENLPPKIGSFMRKELVLVAIMLICLMFLIGMRMRSKTSRVPAIRNKAYYFQEGLTFTLVSTGGFSCRYLPPCIFDMGSPGIFPTKISFFYLLGFLNSRMCRFLLKALNPTINVQVGDVCRIPIKQPKSETTACIETYARECLAIERKRVKF